VQSAAPARSDTLAAVTDLDGSPLAPTTVERLSLPGGPVDVPKCRPRFQRWRGPAIDDTYGGKMVLDLEGEPLFAELVILRLLDREGWTGVWVDSYRRRFRTALSTRVPPASLSDPIAVIYETIERASGRRWGCWDVLAWRGAEVRFVEAKRTRRDRVRPSQLRWLDAALGFGIPLDAFLLVEWELDG
jgi:hypothetical protein